MQGVSKVASRFLNRNFATSHYNEDFKNVVLTHFRVNLERFEKDYGIFLFKKCLISKIRLSHLRNFYDTDTFKNFIKPIRAFWHGNDWEFSLLVHDVLSENFFTKNGSRSDSYYVFDIDFPRESWKRMGTILFPFLFVFGDNTRTHDAFLCYTDILDILSSGDFSFLPEPSEDIVELESKLKQMNVIISEVISKHLANPQNLENLIKNWIEKLDVVNKVQQKYAEVLNFQEAIRERNF